jgi:nitrogen fixation NifU-like protein|tara:strand:+ start:845 stop:1243 length:399 start_codon:yes stop_codon:yes gene_type:complete
MDLKILEIASNTENNKVIKDCTHKAKQKNSICGDQMEISLKIKENKITDFGYQCKSCIYCQASVSLLSSNSINKSVDSIKNLLNLTEDLFEDDLTNIPKEWNIFKKIFNKKNIARKDCLLLPFKAVSKALKL